MEQGVIEHAMRQLASTQGAKRRRLGSADLATCLAIVTVGGLPGIVVVVSAAVAVTVAVVVVACEQAKSA